MATRKTFDEIITSFPQRCADVTPSDSTDFDPSTIWKVAAGDIVVEPAEGSNNITIADAVLAVGAVVPFLCRKVLSTGTTATVKRIY